MDGAVSIRAAGEADFDVLTDLWERSARSSHAFMADHELVELKPHLRDLLLPSMDVWVAESGDELHGFVGARDEHVELLYVAPEAQGRGLGPALLAYVDGGSGPHSVEVYAGNTVGLGFYLSQGFHETRRDPLDAAGRPFPVVHLER
ncbi:GNAT family N-acetyltransferase [Aeromicrobium sp. NPDC092404]|uniref:GNAT family N-acetyltransferase n=1 Tax=Aeromicrobium sp. NPDC092404 TaxID=3154976 RepID=UPI0034255C72